MHAWRSWCAAVSGAQEIEAAAELQIMSRQGQTCRNTLHAWHTLCVRQHILRSKVAAFTVQRALWYALCT